MLIGKTTIRTVSLIGVVWSVIISAAAPAAGPDAQTVASQILEESGVKGGLVVHVGTGDPASWGTLTAALGADSRFVVHGLYGEPDAIARARESIRESGRYGRVSAEPLLDRHLPYADSLVNLLVVSDPMGIPESELTRVLAPGSVAMIRRNGRWQKVVKSRPKQIDDWSHALYDATNNAVAHDTQVGPPLHYQWLASPRYTRHHERLATVSVVVSAGGRLFSIIDQAPSASILLPAVWSVVARDAFSGVKLWERRIPTWEPHLRAWGSGPPEIARTLVATPERAFVTLGLYAPVTALDAATGTNLAQYPATLGTEEMLYDRETLYLVRRELPPGDKDPDQADDEATSPKQTRTEVTPPRGIIALNAQSGKVAWQRPACEPLPMTLAVGTGHVFYATADGITCLNAATGNPIWKTHREFARQRPGWSAPTLVVHDDVVLCADRQIATPNRTDELNHRQVADWLARDGWPGDLIAYSADTGERLWSCRCAEAYHAPVDVFVSDGLVWVGQSRARTGPDFTAGRDLHTGEIKRRLATAKAFETTMPHHRCHRNRATDRFLVLGRTGVEFIDIQTGAVQRHHWTRGTCQFGTLPCNGLLYVPPHSCACYIEGKLTGFLALAPRAPVNAAQATSGQRLVRGPAFGMSVALPKPPATDNADQWPTYRHDPGRRGCASHFVPTELGRLWQTALGGKLTAPVVAGGRVYVASTDMHTLCALDAHTGQFVWQFTTGGRIDSPPTVDGSRVLFGSADGAVYCLRADDGQLAWRFRAAPRDRRVVALEQVESAWPVPGNVLVQDESVYCVAGRSSYLDGGIWIYRLHPETGQVLAQRCISDRDPKTGDQPDEPMMFEMPGALPDVLSTDGQRIYMRHLAFDPQTLAPCETATHLYSPAGFLDDDWWHRSYWIMGRHFYSGHIGWYFAGHETLAGRLMVFDDETLYGFAYRPDFYRGSTGRKYHLFAATRNAQPPQPPADYQRANRDYPTQAPGKFHIKFNWTEEMPLLIRAMVLTDSKLFAAGPPARATQDVSLLHGQGGGLLAVIDTKDGHTLKEYKLDAVPVFDGLAVAGGRLYLTTLDGRVHCLSGLDQEGTHPLATITPFEERPSPFFLKLRSLR